MIYFAKEMIGMSIRPKENIGFWYHQLAKDRTMGGRVFIPKNPVDWPENWKKIEYKTYKNSKKIKFSDNPLIVKKYSELEEVLKKRRSGREFTSQQNLLDLDALGYLLKFSCGELGSVDGEYGEFTHRPHPSGGGRFPLEYYIYVNNPVGRTLSPGLYHYDVRGHQLELIVTAVNNSKIVDNLFGLDWCKNASVFIFITAIFDRTFRKYREMGYRLILQESGHVGQNIYLLATSLGLKVVSVAGTNNQAIEELLMVDGEGEGLVYTILLG